METISAIGLKVAAGVAVQYWKSSNSTVDKEILSAFDKALKDWSVNPAIREIKNRDLINFIRGRLNSNSPLFESEYLPEEYKDFARHFDKRLCEKNTASIYLQKITNIAQFNEEIKLLTNLDKKADDILAVVQGIEKSLSGNNDNSDKDSEEKEEKIKEVKINTIQEFFRELKSNRVLKFANGRFNLSDIVKYNINDNVRWVSEFDGYEPHIKNLKNVTILGSEKTELVIESQYVWVLSFDNCENIKIDSLTIGHTVEGYCMGGVLQFIDCKDIEILNSDLYGCGTYGFNFTRTEKGLIANSIIRDCSYGIGGFDNSKEITINKCEFLGNKEFDLVRISNYSKAIHFNNCKFYENKADDYYFFEVDKTCEEIEVSYSIFESNIVTKFVDNSNYLITRHNKYEQNIFDPPEDKWFDE